MAGHRKCSVVRLLAVWLLLTSGAEAADDITAPPVARREIRDQGLIVSLSPRTPDQLYAFYSARGFPVGALREITRRSAGATGWRWTTWRFCVRWLRRPGLRNAITQAWPVLVLVHHTHGKQHGKWNAPYGF